MNWVGVYSSIHHWPLNLTLRGSPWAYAGLRSGSSYGRVNHTSYGCFSLSLDFFTDLTDWIADWPDRSGRKKILPIFFIRSSLYTSSVCVVRVWVWVWVCFLQAKLTINCFRQGFQKSAKRWNNHNRLVPWSQASERCDCIWFCVERLKIRNLLINLLILVHCWRLVPPYVMMQKSVRLQRKQVIKCRLWPAVAKHNIVFSTSRVTCSSLLGHTQFVCFVGVLKTSWIAVPKLDGSVVFSVIYCCWGICL